MRSVGYAPGEWSRPLIPFKGERRDLAHTPSLRYLPDSHQKANNESREGPLPLAAGNALRKSS